jgi:hypothetical protein
MNEFNFCNYTDDKFRAKYIAKEEKACQNVAYDLLDAYFTDAKKPGNQGKWLKTWFNRNKSDDKLASALNPKPNKTQSAVPSVFGETTADKTDSKTDSTAPQTTEQTDEEETEVNVLEQQCKCVSCVC